MEIPLDKKYIDNRPEPEPKSRIVLFLRLGSLVIREFISNIWDSRGLCISE
jgi:hypothetical protein